MKYSVLPINTKLNKASALNVAFVDANGAEVDASI